ncbi:MAG: hypothetical protein LBJ36_11645 [Synergistaceae bacterium]|nr:hypothetical protein [Synergistaceae bacterium]
MPSSRDIGKVKSRIHQRFCQKIRPAVVVVFNCDFPVQVDPFELKLGFSTGRVTCSVQGDYQLIRSITHGKVEVGSNRILDVETFFRESVLSGE